MRNLIQLQYYSDIHLVLVSFVFCVDERPVRIEKKYNIFRIFTKIKKNLQCLISKFRKFTRIKEKSSISSFLFFSLKV